jgi:hypothetical protein
MNTTSVIARSAATRQSRMPGMGLDCFASLAMTARLRVSPIPGLGAR